MDSTTALRTFEQANGVQAVVKILKRAGTPREVRFVPSHCPYESKRLTLLRRMKCLEFLYFYLLDETPSCSDASSTFTPTSLQPTPPPTAPATPIRPAKPYGSSAAPLRPISRYGSSTYSFSSSSSLGEFSFSELADSALSSSSSKSSPSSLAGSIAKSPRSVSGSSTHSFSSTSSNASSSTAASSVQGSPSLIKESGSVPPPVFIPPDLVKKSPVKAQRVVTPQNQKNTAIPPPNLPPLQAGNSTNGKIFPLQPRSLMMLRKEVDYVPQSPKKVLAVGVGRPPPVLMADVASVGTRSGRIGHRKSLSASTLGSGIMSPALQRKTSDEERTRRTITSSRGLGERSKVGMKQESNGNDNEVGKQTSWKTTEQKKELLGTMLGNVDALVEGVRKAGIWGLG